MDRSLIENKLESLRRCIVRIESRRPDSLAELEGNLDLQDILAVNLERAVQLSVDLAAHILSSREIGPPGSMEESFDRLHALGLIPSTVSESLKKAVGFRKVAVHAYQSIDWAIVFDIAHHRLAIFSDLARHVVALIEGEAGPRA